MLFDKSEIVLFAHHNNLVKTETNNYRNEIKALGGELSVVRNSLLLSYLRAANEPHPASKEAYIKTKDIKHPFAPLLVGPTAIITIPSLDPSVVKKIVKFTKSTNEKLFLVGARIDNKLFDLTEINAFKELPTKEQLHAQLAGLLTIMSGAGLVQTLQTASQHLYLTLDSHHKNIDPASKTEEEPK
jgi:large subunit ribosomal protein L10